jgi:hypothetical protein
MERYGSIESIEQQIAQLREQRDELLEALQLIYSWANNWDSEFMNDPEWREADYPKIQAAIAKATSK